MQRCRWLLGFCGTAVVAMAGCSPDIVDPGYHLYKPDGAHSVASPVEFMTAAGCVSLGRHGLIGAIVVPRPDTGYSLFDCRGFSRDSLQKLTGAYRHLLVEAKLHGASMTVLGGDVTGYWQLVDFNVVCTSSPTSGSNGEYYKGGAYVLPDIGTNATCRDVYTYQWQSNSGSPSPDTGTPGSDGFPSGPPPATATPYPPLLTLDSACKSKADSQPNIYPGIPEGQAALPSFGPLGSLDIQNTLSHLADSAWSSPTHSEMGGVILVHNGQYSFVPIANIYSDICRYGNANQYIPTSGYYVAAYVHTHPPENTPLNSSNCGDPNLQAGPAALGPSQPDVATADTLAPITNTNYVVQRDSRGTMTIERFGTNSNGTQYIDAAIWQFGTANSCAARIY